MIEVELTKTKITEGVWEGVLTQLGANAYDPDVVVTHMNEALGGVEVTKARKKRTWDLRIPIPSHAISEGVQTFLITDRGLDQVLGSFAMMAGDVLSYDIRAEVNLLREELDMLKRSYRRHCRETS